MNYLRLITLASFLFSFQTVFASLSLVALVIVCPEDKNENYSTNCTFEIQDYTGEVIILESDGNVFINQIPTPFTLINQTSEIQIIVTDEGGNVETCFFTIHLPPRPEISFTNTQPFCYGASDGVISSIIVNGEPPYTYEWTNGATTPNLSGVGAGTYGLTVIDANGCTALREVNLSQPTKVELTLNVFTYQGGHNVTSKEATDGSASGTASGGTPPYAWLWSTGENTSSITDLGVGEYWVVVTDFNGCVDTASFTLTPPFIINIPVAISPNGDGLNDVFVIGGLEDHPENELIIFNRWGDIVYKKENYLNDWDGSANAELQLGKKELPDGAYFYHLQIKDEPNVIKGSVIIKRK